MFLQNETKEQVGFYKKLSFVELSKKHDSKSSLQ